MGERGQLCLGSIQRSGRPSVKSSEQSCRFRGVKASARVRLVAAISSLASPSAGPAPCESARLGAAPWGCPIRGLHRASGVGGRPRRRRRRDIPLSFSDSAKNDARAFLSLKKSPRPSQKSTRAPNAAQRSRVQFAQRSPSTPSRRPLPALPPKMAASLQNAAHSPACSSRHGTTGASRCPATAPWRPRP